MANPQSSVAALLSLNFDPKKAAAHGRIFLSSPRAEVRAILPQAPWLSNS
jgi:hypothetical protein